MWYNIRARSIPLDRFVEFWLFAENREKLDEILNRKEYDEIEWIEEKTPPWEKKEKLND